MPTALSNLKQMEVCTDVCGQIAGGDHHIMGVMV